LGGQQRKSSSARARLLFRRVHHARVSMLEQPPLCRYHMPLLVEGTPRASSFITRWTQGPCSRPSYRRHTSAGEGRGHAPSSFPLPRAVYITRTDQGAAVHVAPVAYLLYRPKARASSLATLCPSPHIPRHRMQLLVLPHRMPACTGRKARGSSFATPQPFKYILPGWCSRSRCRHRMPA